MIKFFWFGLIRKIEFLIFLISMVLIRGAAASRQYACKYTNSQELSNPVNYFAGSF
jgi:hypothetical protein